MTGRAAIDAATEQCPACQQPVLRIMLDDQGQQREHLINGQGLAQRIVAFNGRRSGRIMLTGYSHTCEGGQQAQPEKLPRRAPPRGQIGKCRSCPAEMLWLNVRTAAEEQTARERREQPGSTPPPTGAPHPITLSSVQWVVVVSEDLARGVIRQAGVSHFSDCPGAARHRKRQQASAERATTAARATGTQQDLF